MSWLRFDPAMLRHPKFDQYADRPALWSNVVALFVAACGYACEQRDEHPHRTEFHSFIPRSTLARLVPFKGPESVAEAMCVAPRCFEYGLFERDGDDYRIHDFADFAPPTYQTTESESAPMRVRSTSADRMARKRARARDASHVTPTTVTCDVASDVTCDDVTPPLPHSPSPGDLDLRLETREARVTGRHESDAGSDAVTPVGEAGARAERIRAGFVTRFQMRHPGVHPDARAQHGGGGPWLELARLMKDGDVDRFLDAFFADSWCSGDAGLKLGALVSERVRLMTKGPTTPARARPRGQAPAASASDFAAQIDPETGESNVQI